MSCLVCDHLCLDQYDNHGRLSPYSIYVVDAEQPPQPCLCALSLFGESECCKLSGHDDRRICGITCSALFCLTGEMRLILSSSVQITGRANLPINTLIHLEWCVCVPLCVCVHTLFDTVGYMLHMWCTCTASYQCVELGGSDLMHMCGIIHSR